LSIELGLKDCLVWLGERDDMPAIYNTLDILCSSSSYGEGLPNVVIEAMSCGVPAVVTDVGDSAYVVGDTGIVVPPKDPKALAHGLSIMLDGNLILQREKTRIRIISQFSQKALIRNTLDTLTGLLNTYINRNCLSR
jgi:glycosyltransferase involved in cell wall biosynthesis